MYDLLCVVYIDFREMEARFSGLRRIHVQIATVGPARQRPDVCWLQSADRSVDFFAEFHVVDVEFERQSDRGRRWPGRGGVAAGEILAS
jgi:hypothetical protein